METKAPFFQQALLTLRTTLRCHETYRQLPDLPGTGNSLP
jgi:hypothetical protein